jgi:hypothetical protein
MRRGFEMDPEADTLLQRVEFVEIEAIFLQAVELPADPRCSRDHTVNMTSQTPPSAPR